MAILCWAAKNSLRGTVPKLSFSVPSQFTYTSPSISAFVPTGSRLKLGYYTIIFLFHMPSFSTVVVVLICLLVGKDAEAAGGV